MVQTIPQSWESLDSFVHWIKHCLSLKKKCCFKAMKHKIIIWKKKSSFLKQNLYISQISPQKGLLAFMTPCSSNTQMEVYNKRDPPQKKLLDKSHIFNSNVAWYSWFWPEGSINAPNSPWRHESRSPARESRSHVWDFEFGAFIDPSGQNQL